MQEIRGLTHLHFIMIVQGQLSQTIMAVKLIEPLLLEALNRWILFHQRILGNGITCLWLVDDMRLSAD